MPVSIQRNIVHLKDHSGMIFIMNGRGNTDHIDVWRGDGRPGELKGGNPSYFSAGMEIWFWEFA